MHKPYVEPPKMPGYPRRRPEKPRQAPAQPPAPALRLRQGWSRLIVDRAHEESTWGQSVDLVPNVRSTAAARARAGECYRQSSPVEASMNTPAPAPAPVVPVPTAVAMERVITEPLHAYVDQECVDQEMEAPPPAVSLFDSAWSAIKARAIAVLDSLPRAMQSSD